MNMRFVKDFTAMVVVGLLIFLPVYYIGKMPPSTYAQSHSAIYCNHNLPISTTASIQLVAGQTGLVIYICSVNIGPIPTATNVALVEGSGATCGTSTLGLAGGATAATGWNFSANGGIAYGANAGPVIWGTLAGNSVCLLLSAANQVSGHITWTALNPSVF